VANWARWVYLDRADRQNLLKDCLLKLDSDKMRDVIRNKGCGCAHRVEFNDWVKTLRESKDLFNISPSETSNRPLPTVLGSLVQLGVRRRTGRELLLLRSSRFLSMASLFWSYSITENLLKRFITYVVLCQIK
jgi:hypothetical protein